MPQRTRLLYSMRSSVISYNIQFLCVYTACPGDQFRCNDGQCIPSDDRCDFITHCDDESDEDNCRE